MVEDQWQITPDSGGDPHRQLSGRTVLYASMAGLVVSGPLLGLTGLSLFGTLALFVIASPMLLLFSPMLVGLALVVSAAVAAFSAAGAMAVTGMAAFGWAFKQVRPDRPVGLATRVVDKFVGDAVGQKAHIPDHQE